MCFFYSYRKKGPNLAYIFVVRCLENLKNQLYYIEKVVERQTSQESKNN